ncbi:MAG: 30S ribosomal protein S4 [Tenericutes bacterium GWC2_39_45]|nr:MAG: 30S ribosomal protein S4 [Tenericutes bacterium GWA2_38_26]OHE31167.1 MAG: 30S ribosomal protein S4 [Tenericutes bacterium GWC2_39_45]OHE32575.1 MAG: 30S ribosomal protein S4 [Tenericutes bacterium GWD2_38_27]OHE37526.1 MAG: 30S ribosomal protein S4 [Tenericutes bacterium GWE2_38_8]OHE41796.1 MAG: 30S ribosomal protein S4 [Tenericutes bacterium GWF2_38_8]HBG32694.1 30S ribosomal protein S4 [Acholeplasmataceae bacterium]
MSRYTGPSWKISRRLGYSISETGIELKKRPYAPGQHGQRRSKVSDYGTQLQEKQKVRFTYGVSEKQFRKTFDEAGKIKGKTGENFLRLLESRLDNVVYRLGLAKTRAQARQLVNHGHFLVDGKKVDIPSYRLQPNQKIALRETSKGLKVVVDALAGQYASVEFVSFDKDTNVGTFVRYPERKEILPEINEQLIVEFYNR